MFAWFRRKCECPVAADVQQWIDSRWNWLAEQFGADRPRQSTVILPLAEFFPDAFDDSEESIRQMVDRVCQYMGLDPATIAFSVYQDPTPTYPGEWRNGTAGLYHPEGDVFRIWIEVANLDDPLAMVATIAHELAHVHLLGHGRLHSDCDDHEPLTDLLTVFLGLGVFTANSVIREHYWHAGQVSGWSMGRRGYLGMPELGYALARFARMRGENDPQWAKQLRLDVRSAFKRALAFLEQQAAATDEQEGRRP